MSERKFKTTLIWHDSAGGECEAEVLVTYKGYKGFAGDRTDPPEDASVEIHSIFPLGDPSDAVPERFLTDDDLIAECFEHWADDDAAAEDYKAEQRAEMMREDRA